MRTTRYRYAIPLHLSSGADPGAAAAPEKRLRWIDSAADEFDADDDRELWSAWVDIGGEG